jgi:hypothetical protein
MVRSTSAPKVRTPQLLGITYLYAIVLTALAVVQLMGVGGFDFAGIDYQTPGTPGVIVALAGLEIFSLPFLLRLKLSKAARTLSALFSLLTPIFLWLEIVYLVSIGNLPANWFLATAAIALIIIGRSSFTILNGPQVFGFSKK